MNEPKVHSCETRTSIMQHFTSALTLLVGWQAGHPCEILQCFVGWVRGRASSLKKLTSTPLIIKGLANRGSPGKWLLKQCVRV